jgi:hypothetical protein
MGGNEGDKNRDKKIVIVKLIIQKKKTPPDTATTKNSVCLVKVLELFLWCLILVLMLGILGFVGKGAAPLDRQLEVEMAGGFFSFLFFQFPWSCGPSITSGSSDVVSTGD